MVGNLARRWTRNILRPIALFCGKLGLTPNALTIGGFLLVAGVSLVLAKGYFRLGGILLLLTVWLDAVDGALARETDQVTRFGAFLDSTLDRYAETLLYLGLLVYYTPRHVDYMVYLIYLTITGSLLVSYTRARAEAAGIPVTEGLLTRFERLVILILGLIFLHLEAALWILAPLTHVTAVQRMLIVWKRAE